ncbi:hypothetical protein B0H10DRAFT_1966594 [Mycena sp. CBHHK59/15]|nr:hypothetical protein B0H10DRAFT_1966594 [Mycena sp. CBHHK59/15]
MLLYGIVTVVMAEDNAAYTRDTPHGPQAPSEIIRDQLLIGDGRSQNGWSRGNRPRWKGCGQFGPQTSALAYSCWHKMMVPHGSTRGYQKVYPDPYPPIPYPTNPRVQTRTGYRRAADLPAVPRKKRGSVPKPGMEEGNVIRGGSDQHFVTTGKGRRGGMEGPATSDSGTGETGDAVASDLRRPGTGGAVASDLGRGGTGGVESYARLRRFPLRTAASRMICGARSVSLIFVRMRVGVSEAGKSG